MRASSIRLVLVVSTLVMVVAACSAEPTTTTSGVKATEAPSDDAAPATTELPAPSTVATTLVTTEAPSGPAQLDLSPVAADPDPKLTLLPLESVLIEMVDDYLVVTFGVPEFELNVGFDDSDGNTVSCGSFEGVNSCSVFKADGAYDNDVYDLAMLDLDVTQVAFPVVIDGGAGTITVRINGVDYVGEKVDFMDGPLFVQFDINTGGLADEVTRIRGEATVAEVVSALG